MRRSLLNLTCGSAGCGRRSRKPEHQPAAHARTPTAFGAADARRRPGPAPYVAAVVVGVGAGLVFSGWHGLGAGGVPLAVALGLPLSAVLAIRTWSAEE